MQMGGTGAPEGLTPSVAVGRLMGSRSAPVAWSTSRMDRLMRWPAKETTFTHTSCPRFTTSFALPTLQQAVLVRHCRSSCRTNFNYKSKLVVMQSQRVELKT